MNPWLKTLLGSIPPIFLGGAGGYALQQKTKSSQKTDKQNNSSSLTEDTPKESSLKDNDLKTNTNKEKQTPAEPESNPIKESTQKPQAPKEAKPENQDKPNPKPPIPSDPNKTIAKRFEELGLETTNEFARISTEYKKIDGLTFAGRKALFTTDFNNTKLKKALSDKCNQVLSSTYKSDKDKDFTDAKRWCRKYSTVILSLKEKTPRDDVNQENARWEATYNKKKSENKLGEIASITDTWEKYKRTCEGYFKQNTTNSGFDNYLELAKKYCLLEK